MKKLISLTLVLLLLVILVSSVFAHPVIKTKEVTYTNVVYNLTGWKPHTELRLNGVLINKGETRIFNDIPVNYEFKTWLFKNPDGTPLYSKLVATGTLTNGTNTIQYQLPNKPPQFTVTVDVVTKCNGVIIKPTIKPTVSPTTEPTVSPTTEPTVSPTTEPTVSPTTEPTVSPSSSSGVVNPESTNTIVTTTKELPKTGEGSQSLIIMGGLLLVVIGLCIMYFKKEKL